MKIDPTGQTSNKPEASYGADFVERHGRSLVTGGLGLFVVSVALPIIASLYPAELLPQWVGIFDVGLALMLVVMGVLIDAATRAKVDNAVVQVGYRIYRNAAVLPLVLLVVFFLAGEAIKWNVLLPGLAWRTWLILYAVPALLVAWRYPRAQAG